MLTNELTNFQGMFSREIFLGGKPATHLKQRPLIFFSKPFPIHL